MASKQETIDPPDSKSIDDKTPAEIKTEVSITSFPIPGVTRETIDLSDNSDSLDESCVIIDADGDVISGTAVVSSDRNSQFPTSHQMTVDESSTIIVLDSPEKAFTDPNASLSNGEPPRKKLILHLPAARAESVKSVKNSDKTDRQTSPPVPYNIFSSLLVTRANSATPPETPIASTPSVSLSSVSSEASNDATAVTLVPGSNVDVAVAAATVLAESSAASNTAVSDSSSRAAPNGPSPGSSRSSSRCSSRTPVLKDISLSCHLPFCESKCDVETHHPLLRALSTCIGAIAYSSSSSSSDVDVEAKREAAFEAFEAVVSKWEADCAEGWNRTKAIKEMAKMKEYHYPLLHTATVSGCVRLVRWMLSKGFGDFSKPICSPLMQCLLNIDCAVRKHAEKIRIFREMMELMPSEMANPILDSTDRPTSLLIVACSRASRDTSDRAFFAPSLRNIITFITERFDVEIQRRVLQVRNSEGNTCVHELSRLDETLPILRKLHELCHKLGIVESVFKATNLRGKTALDLAAEAGAIRLVPFLSPIVPSNKAAPPPVRTPGDVGKEKSATPVATTTVEVVTKLATESLLAKGLEGSSREDPIQTENHSKTITPEATSTDGVGPCDAVSSSVNTSEHVEESVERVMVEIPVVVDDVKQSDESSKEEDEAQSFRALFRPLFREDTKTESKLKIVEKHLTEKRKLASDVKSRMEKHGKNVDEIKVKIEETEEDTRKKIENMKVIYEVLLRTQQAIGANDAKLKELNSQLVGERKSIAMHEKVSEELADVSTIMDQLHSTLTHQMTLNACK